MKLKLLVGLLQYFGWYNLHCPVPAGFVVFVSEFGMVQRRSSKHRDKKTYHFAFFKKAKGNK